MVKLNVLIPVVGSLFVSMLLSSCMPGGGLKGPDKSIYEPRKVEFRE